ncbi:MAG: pyroglutamyl-peptidase I, partial [Erysipelotrichaceae bacterium]|nr:pyroglutamyl-peptidase I [Erysipelotrichaceae bacterium]
MKILLTGFEPFGGETVNPAQEAVALVKDEIKGAQI